MKSTLTYAFEAFNEYSGWIAWNLFLAFIPLALSFWLFYRTSRKRSPLWWMGWIVFMAFLPNAAYLLTDIIHLIQAIRAGYSIWITTLVFIPLHLFAILLGWEAYVVSIINQSRYLERQGVKKFVSVSELIVHALSAIAIYLGRFIRFNSWDLVTQPHTILNVTIDNLTDKKPLLVVVITFFILTVFYWLMKQVTLGIVLQIRDRK